MSAVDRLLKQVRAICFTPTFAERQTQSDLYFMNLTQIGLGALQTMCVSRRKDGPGIVLVASEEFVNGLSDTDLRTVLCHEAQHIRRKDLDAVTEFQADRDWYNGWKGPMLVNMAADCIINDGLVAAGMAPIEDGLYGPTEVGFDCAGADLVRVMRELSKKPPPPEDPSMGDLNESDVKPDSETAPVEINIAEEEALRSKMSKTGKGKPANLALTDDQIRWAAFLATILDTRKQEDSFKQVPRRLSGVKEFSEREYVRPAVRPLPRKRATIAIDTSGSMAVQLVTRLCNAVRNSPAQYELDVVCFNTGLTVWSNFRQPGPIPNVGGGTDLQTVTDHVNDRSQFPERIIVLTDGDFEMPANLKNPDRWVFMIYGADARGWGQHRGLKAVQLEKLLGK